MGPAKFAHRPPEFFLLVRGQGRAGPPGENLRRERVKCRRRSRQPRDHRAVVRRRLPSASSSQRVFAAAVRIFVIAAAPRPPAAAGCARRRRGRGKTLNVISASAPNRPRLPTKNFGRSKPAAFFTTFPPIRSRRPRHRQSCTPEDKVRAGRRKRNLPGPPSPAATVPPSVAPASTSSGSKGQILPARPEGRDDLPHRRARERRERELARLIFHDAGSAAPSRCVHEIASDRRKPRLGAFANNQGRSAASSGSHRRGPPQKRATRGRRGQSARCGEPPNPKRQTPKRQRKFNEQTLNLKTAGALVIP